MTNTLSWAVCNTLTFHASGTSWSILIQVNDRSAVFQKQLGWLLTNVQWRRNNIHSDLVHGWWKEFNCWSLCTLGKNNIKPKFGRIVIVRPFTYSGNVSLFVDVMRRIWKVVYTVNNYIVSENVVFNLWAPDMWLKRTVSNVTTDISGWRHVVCIGGLTFGDFVRFKATLGDLSKIGGENMAISGDFVRLKATLHNFGQLGQL